MSVKLTTSNKTSEFLLCKMMLLIWRALGNESGPFGK